MTHVVVGDCTRIIIQVHTSNTPIHNRTSIKEMGNYIVHTSKLRKFYISVSMQSALFVICCAVRPC